MSRPRPSSEHRRSEQALLSEFKPLDVALLSPPPEVLPPAASPHRLQRAQVLQVLFLPRPGYVQATSNPVAHASFGFPAADGQSLRNKAGIVHVVLVVDQVAQSDMSQTVSMVILGALPPTLMRSELLGYQLRLALL